MSDDLDQLIAFTSALEGLKKLERFRGMYYWRDYPTPAQYESVADHSWRLAMLVLLFAPKLARPLDLDKALKMALVHDIPEIVTGDESPLGEDGTGKDTHAFNADVRASKHEREKAHAREFFAQAGAAGDELHALWLECEEHATFEARVVKALDKAEALLQVLEYRQGHMFPAHLEFTTSYARKTADVDPAIKSYVEELAERMRKRFKEFP